jgi:hypothetical protein
MDSIVHFEMPAEDKARMIKFYQDAFGWQTQQMGPEFGNYVTATTTETDENQMIKNPGAINGGFYDKSGPDDHTKLTVSVPDIKQAMEKVKAAGGKVQGSSKGTEDPDEIPGVGLYMNILDTEGNPLSLLQPAPRGETNA